MSAESSSLPFRVLILEVKGNLPATRDVVREHGKSFPILLDSEAYARKALHVTNTPTIFVIDHRGAIRAHMLGAVSELRSVIGEIIERWASP
jgi:hypothetical protein